MDDTPATSTVIAFLARKGQSAVIVGSWPQKMYHAKDIDVVVRPRKLSENRHPVFEKLREAFGSACHSTGPGHIRIAADPQPVEVFESNARKDVRDPAKGAGVLSYHQAKTRSHWLDCYSYPFRAVS